ncbi:hypothetical protein BpHYR1_009661 [Brachionus plicatilis]|uniref:Uncharacterized protein n=1 Tax=Brachionus plicatilis TaxID=10195 RepID=A0A3M7QUI4_BRAPC|nr:hypothetical protein BpHYR1_009661 [Brachionus plicatilis]
MSVFLVKTKNWSIPPIAPLINPKHQILQNHVTAPIKFVDRLETMRQNLCHYGPGACRSEKLSIRS